MNQAQASLGNEKNKTRWSSDFQLNTSKTKQIETSSFPRKEETLQSAGAALAHQRLRCALLQTRSVD
jgi:hypothetical protein